MYQGLGISLRIDTKWARQPTNQYEGFSAALGKFKFLNFNLSRFSTISVAVLVNLGMLELS